MIRSSKPLAVAFTALLLAASQAKAQQLAVNFTQPGVDFSNNAWSLGWSFNVLTPISVSALGMYDDNADGFVDGSHDVGIWDGLGNLLGSATVTSTSRLNGFFRMIDVSPFLLGVGTDYRIASTTGRDNYTWATVGKTVDPNIEFIGDAYEESATLAYPSIGPRGEDGWYGANFESAAVVVPEPATFALMAPLVLVIGGVMRRRAKRA